MNRPSEPPDRRQHRAALLLLIVHALFVVLPGVHLLAHEHATGLAAVVATASGHEDPPDLHPDCGDGCSHPYHHHDRHATRVCALCHAIGSWTSHPATATPTGRSTSSSRPLVVTFAAPGATREHGTASARAPPDPFAA